MISNYLEQFPEEHRQFVHNRFSQAYVFPEQSYKFGEDDVVDLSPGPRTLKTRVLQNCEDLRPLVDEDRQKVLDTVVSTIDEADGFLLEVKAQVDQVWKEARAYAVLHPRKERNPQPVSEAQKNFLRSLGCVEIANSKAEASKLIERYKKKTNGHRKVYR